MRQKLISKIFLILLGISPYTDLQAQIQTDPVKENSSYPIMGSDLLWKQELEVRKLVANNPAVLKSNTLRKISWSFTVNSSYSWYADNFTTNQRYLVPSTCKAVGNNCYVFVEDASWSSGRVTQSAVDSVLINFDSKTPANSSKGIYQLNTETFGNPPNVDSDSKIIILLLDIVDGYSGSGGYVAGYFYSFNEVNPSTPGYSTSNFAEIFFIDTNPLNLTTATGLKTGLSTLAHEFQHMIHFNYDPQEITFVNESFSTLAEVVCGFPIYNPSLYANEPNHYLFDWRSGEDIVLNDYSRSARFSVYLRDQAGIGVIKNIVSSTSKGTSGIDAGLAASGSSLRFNSLLPNWFIANILDDRTIDPLYGYNYPNLPKSVGRSFLNPNVPLTTDTVQKYAVQYLHFKKGTQLRATITCSNSALTVKAVEIGPTTKRVLNVTSGVEFYEPEFGTTYNEVHFVIMNTSANTNYTYTYQASGTSEVLELRYDYSEPTGVYNLAANDTVCVVFNAVQEGRLDSVRVALRRNTTIRGGIWKYTGVVRPSPLGEPLALNLTATGLSTPSFPYPVPYTNWVTIDLRQKNINTNAPFAVGFIMDGAYTGTTYNYVMATQGPYGSGPTSFTYSSGSTSGPNWYYYTTNSNGDSIVYYLVRAYVSFPLSVYPGDANNDGIVDVRDILPIGLYYGKTGSARLGGSILWKKQFIAQNWTPIQACYADCDGNGTVDSNDVIAIIQNWNATIAGGVPSGLVTASICQELLNVIDKNEVSGPMLSIRNAITSYLNQLKVVSTENVPLSFELYQNYPNPFNPTTNFKIQISNAGLVTLKIYDVLGREIAELINEMKPVGTYEITWNALNLPSGIYFSRLQVGSYSKTIKIILAK